MQIFKLSKTCLPFDFITYVRIPQALRNDLSVIHTEWNFALEITNICIRKPQQLKGVHVIDRSIGGIRPRGSTK